MRTIASEDIVTRIRFENPWWERPTTLEWQPRAYFDLFYPLVTLRDPHRALVLMGPRRVGKTVMIHHGIQRLIADGTPAKSICYLSVDHPIYTNLSLEKLLAFYSEATGVDHRADKIYVVFDEIQYSKNWEVHLKVLVDTYPNIKLIASGSAAAALRMKSHESGAGRFTDFLLPPLTFYEYLELLGKLDLVSSREGQQPIATNLDHLNQEFLNYINFGGYPEAIFSPQIQADQARFIKSDIIDRVLLRDLPSLYGIGDIQELNQLFTTLAFNTGDEVSLGELSQNSGVAKNTIKRYIEYLEAAFLIKCVHRIDRNAKRFHRANFFKVYLTNPSMRAALFSPLTATDAAMGPMVETAMFAQWFHSDETLYYARWQDGEVDLVRLSEMQKPTAAVEMKWSDRYCDKPEELKSLLNFCRANRLKTAGVSSIAQTKVKQVEDVTLFFRPASLICFGVGEGIIHRRKSLI